MRPHFSDVYQLYFPDLYNYPSEELESLELLGERLHSFMNDRNIEKSILVGHSLGGYIALEICKKYPSLVSKLVLMNTTPFSDTKERKNEREKVIDFLQRKGVEDYARGLIPLQMAKDNRHKSVIEKLVDQAKTYSVDQLIALIQAMKNRADSSSLIRECPVPLLFLMGERDSMIPQETRRQIRELSEKVRMVTIKNCGHIIPAEKPNLSSQTIINFFEKQ